MDEDELEVADTGTDRGVLLESGFAEEVDGAAASTSGDENMTTRSTCDAECGEDPARVEGDGEGEVEAEAEADDADSGSPVPTERTRGSFGSTVRATAEDGLPCFW